MISNPLAIVTGAAQRIGRNLALSLARQGYAIVVHYNTSEHDARQMLYEIEQIGVPGILLQSDLSEKEGIANFIGILDSHLSTTDSKVMLLVNSASVMEKAKGTGLEADEWDATIDLNLRAPYLLSTNIGERMPEGGMIVNISDIGAQKLWTRYPAYVISKSALDTMTRLLAKSLAPRIRVNAIAPGLVFRSQNIEEDEWNNLVEKLPLQRATPPEDITATLEFLLKNKSITGQTIVVDSGYSLLGQ